MPARPPTSYRMAMVEKAFSPGTPMATACPSIAIVTPAPGDVAPRQLVPAGAARDFADLCRRTITEAGSGWTIDRMVTGADEVFGKLLLTRLIGWSRRTVGHCSRVTARPR